MKKIILTILCFLSLSINAHSIPNAFHNNWDCYPSTWDYDCYDGNVTPDTLYRTWERSEIGYKNDPDILIRDPNWNKYDNENLGKDLF